VSYQTSLFAPPGIEPIHLRPYQGEGLDQARALIRKGFKRILLVLPTGGGKTVCAASVMAGTVAKGKRALFVGPRREIIAQSFWKLIDAGVPEHDTGVIMGNGWIVDRAHAPYSAHRPHARAQVASVQTLQNRKLPPADVVFWDEAHHAVSDTHERVIQHYVDAGAVVIGLTATPERADRKGLGRVFEVLHQIATPKRLISEGFLAEPRVLGPDVSFADVKRGCGGDFDAESLEHAVDERILVGDVVKHWHEEAGDRTTVAFCTSLPKSQALAETFRAMGVRAEHIDGKMPNEQRDDILARLARGQLQVVCNFGLLTEGWDLPRAKCGIINRPTDSVSLWLQMCGRFLRPWQGITPVILDHGGNQWVHGRPQDDRDWSLDGPSKRCKGLVETVRLCPQCKAPLDGGVAVCPACFYVFPVRQGSAPIEVDGRLVEMSEADSLAFRRRYYRDVMAEAVHKGFSVGWARHQYRHRFKAWPQFYRDEKDFFESKTA
jgi:DNA repair protein RadD